jgi:hypothetical protein
VGVCRVVVAVVLAVAAAAAGEVLLWLLLGVAGGEMYCWGLVTGEV